MANPYASPADFMAWMPQLYIAKLTDDSGGINVSDPLVQESLDNAAEELESGLMVRNDIPIPALNADGSTPTRVKQFLFRVALYNLLSRRAFMNDTVRENFDIEMTWLNQIVNRQKNLKVADSNDKNTTETNDQPIVGWDDMEGRRSSCKKRIFDHFHF